MMCTTGSTPKIEIELRLKLKSIKSKFKRNVAETNWHNRALIKEFSTAGPHRLHKIIGTTSTKEIDIVTTDRSTWYKHKMSIEGGEWTEVRWMMITKKRCIVQQGSGYLKVTSERSKRELRKHMEVMEHIKALGGLKKSVSNEVITYQTNTSEFPPIQVQRGFWENIAQRYKMKLWGESIKLVHHYGARLLEWSSIKARMRGSASDTNTHQSSKHIDFEDDSADESDSDQQGEQSSKGAEGERNSTEGNSQRRQKRKRKSKKG